MRTVGFGITTCLVCASLGCFNYIPLDPVTAPVGESVRAHLTEVGQYELRERTRMLFGTSFDGTLVERRDGRLFFQVRAAKGPSGLRSTGTLYQRIDVPLADVVSVERRELDKTKTLGLALGTTGAVAVAVITTLSGEPASQAPPGGGGPDERVIVPIFLLRFPFP